MKKKYLVTLLVFLFFTLGIYAIRAPLRGIYVLAAVILTNDMCQQEIVMEVDSPDGKYKAVLFQYDCGATTPFTSNVSILKNGKELNRKSGNVFSARGGKIRGDWGGPFTSISWSQSNKLIISVVEDAEVFKKKSSKGNVSIIYDLTIPPPSTYN